MTELPPLPEWALQIAAQCWCDPTTEMIEMDSRLAFVFADKLAIAVAAEQVWRETVDDMLTVCHAIASDDPRESINRLINWNVSVAIDPSVSSDAAALVAAAVAAERDAHAADRMDTERYRYLRDAGMDERNRLEHYASQSLDSAIDAAIRARSKE
jgi:hypothetical protein